MAEDYMSTVWHRGSRFEFCCELTDLAFLKFTCNELPWW